MRTKAFAVGAKPSQSNQPDRRLRPRNQIGGAFLFK